MDRCPGGISSPSSRQLTLSENSFQGISGQRVRRAIDDLAQEPRPYDSRGLDTTELDVPDGVELRRIRLEEWRLIYAVNDSEGWIWVWGVRKRPPYDYQDLEEMAARL